MTTPILLLLVEDNPADAHLLMETLEEAADQSWQITHVQRLSIALKHLASDHFDAILLDLSLPDSKELDTISQIRTAAQDLPIVVLTGLDDKQIAVQAVARGAQDYLVKGTITPEVLIRAIRYAIERGRILKQLQAEVLERQRSEQTLRMIVEGTASVVGDDFFRSLVRSLAEALGVRYALVSGCESTAPTRVRTFAFWHDNEFGKNFEYDLADTPCEQVINSKGCQYYASNLQSLFPKDGVLVEWQAESYLGIALLDSTGKILGHLAVLDDKPMEDEPRNRAVLEIFAARAAAEIERQQAEAALRMSEEKFSTAFRSSPDAITISTLDNGCYVEVNDSCLHMLGYHREEMLGHSALELGIWAKPEDRDALVRSLQEKESVSKIELQFRKKSGELFPALFSAEIIHLENEPCLLSVATDITALKQAEKALERLAEIGELATMIVHEVRNPLTTISMSLSSFKRLDLPDRYQEYLALASDESDRLQRLLNQILLYAKPQTFQPIELELNSFITDMVASLQPIYAADGKQLQFTINPSPLKILADRDKLKQVFINLVTNAFEAIEEGVVAIATTNPTPNHVCIQIHNNGHPIPSDILPKLTRPFFTTKSTGTGLGLAIVKRIVEAHGGEFSIESSVSEGTTARVKLPLVVT